MINIQEGDDMEWHVVDTLASPETGTMFSCIECNDGIKLIIWYKGDIIISSGSIIEPAKGGVLINGWFVDIYILKTTPFNSQFWTTLKSKLPCTYVNDKDSVHCLCTVKCLLSACPFGRKQYFGI